MNAYILGGIYVVYWQNTAISYLIIGSNHTNIYNSIYVINVSQAIRKSYDSNKEWKIYVNIYQYQIN